MSIVTIEDTNLTNIADAIRNKNGTSTKYKPNQMASAIEGISGSEDLSTEFNTYETHLDTQETTIEDIVSALENKANPSEDLSTEFNTYETHLDTQETTIEDIISILQEKGWIV